LSSQVFGLEGTKRKIKRIGTEKQKFTVKVVKTFLKLFGFTFLDHILIVDAKKTIDIKTDLCKHSLGCVGLWVKSSSHIKL